MDTFRYKTDSLAALYEVILRLLDIIENDPEFEAKLYEAKTLDYLTKMETAFTKRTEPMGVNCPICQHPIALGLGCPADNLNCHVIHPQKNENGS